MNSYLTKEDVIQDLALNNAINDAVIVASLGRAFADVVQDIVEMSLSLYHRHGRVDVDQEAEMLGGSLTEIIMQTHSQLGAPYHGLRADIVLAILAVSTMSSH